MSNHSPEAARAAAPQVLPGILHYDRTQRAAGGRRTGLLPCFRPWAGSGVGADR
jgi:hypothetical protein